MEEGITRFFKFIVLCFLMPSNSTVFGLTLALTPEGQALAGLKVSKATLN